MDLLRAGLAALLLAGLLLVALLRARRRSAPYRPRVARLPEDAFPAGRRAPLTAFYFTSRLCGECQETAAIVRDAAPEVPVVALAVHERPDLVRALGVFETPTLLLVDQEGRIRYARVGNPGAEELWTYVREAWDSLEAEGSLRRDALAV